MICNIQHYKAPVARNSSEKNVTSKEKQPVIVAFPKKDTDKERARARLLKAASKIRW